mmetsp:Transcript_91226/g.277050  ORF Transcript_91226/g.277050 Transcript_91226/m.277050 type:complete len:281 (-) Transcript_91226:22-864(-)
MQAADRCLRCPGAELLRGPGCARPRRVAQRRRQPGGTALARQCHRGAGQGRPGAGGEEGGGARRAGLSEAAAAVQGPLASLPVAPHGVADGPAEGSARHAELLRLSRLPAQQRHAKAACVAAARSGMNPRAQRSAGGRGQQSQRAPRPCFGHWRLLPPPRGRLDLLRPRRPPRQWSCRPGTASSSASRATASRVRACCGGGLPAPTRGSGRQPASPAAPRQRPRFRPLCLWLGFGVGVCRRLRGQRRALPRASRSGVLGPLEGICGQILSLPLPAHAFRK